MNPATCPDNESARRKAGAFGPPARRGGRRTQDGTHELLNADRIVCCESAENRQKVRQKSGQCAVRAPAKGPNVPTHHGRKISLSARRVDSYGNPERTPAGGLRTLRKSRRREMPSRFMLAGEILFVSNNSGPDRRLLRQAREGRIVEPSNQSRLIDGSFYEAREQAMRVEGLRLQLRVELHVLLQLDHSLRSGSAPDNRSRWLRPAVTAARRLQ